VYWLLHQGDERVAVMVAVSTFETSVDLYHTTPRNIPEGPYTHSSPWDHEIWKNRTFLIRNLGSFFKDNPFIFVTSSEFVCIYALINTVYTHTHTHIIHRMHVSSSVVLFKYISTLRFIQDDCSFCTCCNGQRIQNFPCLLTRLPWNFCWELLTLARA
jgi:hypothetical protein